MLQLITPLQKGQIVATQQEALARRITLPLLIFYGLGNILGAGIYVLVGEVAGIAGMFTPLSFLVALGIVSFTALSYSELVTRFPVSAGVAAYIKEGFGSTPLSLAVGLTIAAAGLVSSATIARGFSGYLNELFTINDTIAVVCLLLLLGSIAVWGIRQSVLIASLFTLMEIGGLLLIIIVGAPELLELPAQLPSLMPSFELTLWGTIFVGAFLAFYAFLGFEDMVNIAEEVKEPTTVFPKAIIISLIIASLLYLSVSLIAILLLSPAELAESKAPIADLYHQATGKSSTIITLIGLFAIVNGALIQIIMASRIVYGMSAKGWLPHTLSLVNSKTHTPIVATSLVTAVAIAFALWLPIVVLANITSTLILLVFTLVNIALIRVKLKDPHPENIKTVGLWIPICGTIVNIIFLALQLVAL